MCRLGVPEDRVLRVWVQSFWSLVRLHAELDGPSMVIGVYGMVFVRDGSYHLCHCRSTVSPHSLKNGRPQALVYYYEPSAWREAFVISNCN